MINFQQLAIHIRGMRVTNWRHMYKLLRVVNCRHTYNEETFERDKLATRNYEAHKMSNELAEHV